MLYKNDETGFLKVNITNEEGIPIDATVSIYEGTDEENPVDVAETNSIGQTERIELPAPPQSISEAPGIIIPYAMYNIVASAPGFAPVSITGSNIFSGILSIQNIILTENPGIYNIGPNTLIGNYPPKIPEAEIKPIENTGEIVLDRVVVPETIVVHDGVPSDSTATDYYVPFADYIKNVASSEIYPTWPRETIKANVIAIISFTLNRVYTEW